MGDGSKKKICDVNVGETVLTINENTKLYENKQVIDVHHNMSSGNDMYEIEMENGNITTIMRLC